MDTLSSRRSALFSRLASVVRALGGASPKCVVLDLAFGISMTGVMGTPRAVAFVTDCVTSHTLQLGETLLTDEGLDYFIILHKAQDPVHCTSTESVEALESRLQGATNAFLFEAALNLLDLYGPSRASQLDADLRLVRNDVQQYLHARLMAAQILASHGPPSSAQAVSQRSCQSIQTMSLVNDEDAMSSDESPPPLTPINRLLTLPSFAHLSGCSREVDRASIDAKRAVLAEITTFARFYSLARRDLEWGLAASESRHPVFSGNHGHIARPFPDIDMLHEVVPDLVSITIDIPFSVARRVSEQPRPFPYLTRLTIDETNVSVWKQQDMDRTVLAFHAGDIPELHFVNARRATVKTCSEFVCIARTCILVDDSDNNTRHIGFVDQRNFERYVYGSFVNNTSFMYNDDCKWFWSSITTLTLAHAMPDTELPMLFGCFPEGLEHLRIWFDAGRVLERHETALLRYRDAGSGCCAQLQRLTLTTAWPFRSRRSASSRRVPVNTIAVHAFLRHLHGGRDLDVQIDVEGAVELA
ncbi:hypothetical protein AURDEDRAFT_170135 [Auricularia subglabra TFB-10046 SS5]|nr:hypothetical protein AURDEDRAFT_170135 [Auricularia subglabra TFB-10046 SS5]